jgi:hypothetical protein
MKIFTVSDFADKPPEGCAENPYHKIAVTILACFCTDPDLVSPLKIYIQPYAVYFGCARTHR